MGESRSGTRRSGAQALPLTRRQQKRARQRTARQQIEQRQTPSKPPQPAKAERPARTKEPTVVAPITNTAHPHGSAPVANKRTAKTLRAALNGHASEPVVTPAPSNPPAFDKPKRMIRRLKSGAPGQAPKAGSAARTHKAASAAMNNRKYPTLARMVAVVPHPEPAVAAHAEEMDDEEQVTRRDAARAEADAVEEPLDLPPARDDERGLAPLDLPLVPADSPDGRAAARRPLPARRLAPADDQAYTHLETSELGASDPAPHAAFGARPLPLPEPDLVIPVAAAHAALAAAAALTGAGLLITGGAYAFWPLTLAVLIGTGGWLGYAVSGRSHWQAALLLVLAQMSVLGWLLALIGARAAILALVPIVALLALRWLGRAGAYAVALCALALYAFAALLELNGALPSPLALSPSGYALLDGGFVAAGLLGVLLLGSHLYNRQIRAERVARARQHEVRTLRRRLTGMRQQVEDDAARLDDALGSALAGRGATHPVETNGLLSPLTETANAAAERLATLQREREDRLRLEGAVRTVTQAVERAWLGLSWSWPEWSGTVLDELVALLRTPRPQETRANSSDDAVTLTALPTVERGMTPRPWERPTPISMPVSAVRPPWSPASSGKNGQAPAQQPDPSAAGAEAPSALLPWREWDTWRDWVGARED
ncbi:MAG TPA: hypothetical protein VKQ30_00015 [Ktedonobacterales bacterium]|nr:hypothetical protein [Ktedonobacterales bacterium]